MLVDADSDRDLLVLAEGQQIDLATLPSSNLNVRAETGTGVEYVVFGLNGDDEYSSEGTAPYALAGDRSGDYRAWTPSVGEHALTATAFDDDDTAGAVHSVTFTIMNGDGEETVTVAAPSSLTAAATAPNLVTLNWVDNANNEQNLHVERSLNGGAFGPLVTLPAGSTSYQDGAVAADTAYAYRVRASAASPSGVVYSAYSNVATARTPALPAPPAAPSGLTATAVSSTRVELSWVDNAGDEDGFEVHRAPAGSTNWGRLATVGRDVRSYLDEQVAAGASYAYRIIAYNANGASAASNTATVSVPAAEPTGPRVTGFRLIDAASDRELGELLDGAVIDRAALGTTQFNIRAMTGGAVLSVRFAFDGDTSFRTENDPPFSLFGDRNGDYRSWAAGPGVYTLTATAFGATDARGVAGGSRTITFRVV